MLATSPRRISNAWFCGLQEIERRVGADGGAIAVLVELLPYDLTPIEAPNPSLY